MAQRRRKWWGCKDCDARFPSGVKLMNHRRIDHPKNGKAEMANEIAKEVEVLLTDLNEAPARTSDVAGEVIWAVGRIEGFLQAHAEGIGLSGRIFADRVLQLLYRRESRFTPGAPDSMPAVRRAASRRAEVRA